MINLVRVDYSGVSVGFEEVVGVIVPRTKMSRNHVLHPNILTQFGCLVKCKMGQVGAVLCVQKRGVHYGKVTVLELHSSVRNAVGVEAVRKEVGAVVLRQVSRGDSTAQNTRDVKSPILRLETFAVFVDDEAESGATLLMKHVKRTNINIFTKLQLKPSGDWYQIEVVAQPVVIPLAAEVKKVVKKVVVRWIEDGEWLVVVSH